MPVTMNNSTSEEQAPDAVPVRPDGGLYRFEMLFDGFKRRAYSDSAEDLLSCLIRGYEDMTVARRLAARLKFAVEAQVAVQSAINAYNDLSRCTPEEFVVLDGHRNTPPDIREWGSEVPLVLVDTYYAPTGSLPRPVSLIADVANPPNLFWLSPEDPYDFLITLANVGVIGLNESVDDQA